MKKTNPHRGPRLIVGQLYVNTGPAGSLPPLFGRCAEISWGIDAEGNKHPAALLEDTWTSDSEKTWNPMLFLASHLEHVH